MVAKSPLRLAHGADKLSMVIIYNELNEYIDALLLIDFFFALLFVFGFYFGSSSIHIFSYIIHTYIATVYLPPISTKIHASTHTTMYINHHAEPLPSISPLH